MGPSSDSGLRRHYMLPTLSSAAKEKQRAAHANKLPCRDQSRNATSPKPERARKASPDLPSSPPLPVEVSEFLLSSPISSSQQNAREIVSSPPHAPLVSALPSSPLPHLISAPHSPPPPWLSAPIKPATSWKRRKRNGAGRAQAREPARQTRGAVWRGDRSPVRLGRRWYGKDGRAEERVKRVGDEMAKRLATGYESS
ncbi:hypothetical protein IAQ61_004957 [Plenodomus lingam]|uniref:Predicted protein n=1 Tax=Leptosphaeria maculans (strain JN3 / isolate v23.1.3 / race Av1-4-5-6-7-8) TaxID=985895 RepID=E4ZT92_LEPMJ|nr:predicted protein [Plenodomus lingam JN3]KAH9872557.1 hypothetical protein IAQ61_004957 [Plenodomus lingam]CBX90034.1 predicted protein [Plenodomus lingam JN3]